MKKTTPILISVAGTILSAAAFAFWRLRKGSPLEQNSSPDISENKPTKPTISPDTIYKTKGIKKVEIKVAPKMNLMGLIIGEARVRPDERDKYNVDIITPDHILVGHIEKNRRLSNSISAWHNGVVFSFVLITSPSNGDESPATGHAFIATGLKEKEVEELKTALGILKEREIILAREEINSNTYLRILEDHELIYNNFKKNELLNDIDISLSKRIIPTMSKQMEEEENWQALLELEKHAPLIDELNERFAGTTYRRISKARKMTGIKQ